MYGKYNYMCTPPTDEIGITRGVGGGSVRPKTLKKCMKLNLNFQRGGGGSWQKSPPSVGGVYGYFLELHNEGKLAIVLNYNSFQQI